MNFSKRLFAHFSGSDDALRPDDLDAALEQACALEGGQPYLAGALTGFEGVSPDAAVGADSGE
jgi:hypothetical protein